MAAFVVGAANSYSLQSPSEILVKPTQIHHASASAPPSVGSTGAPVGIAVIAGGIAGVLQKGRAARTARNFFGAESKPVAKTIKSYKDFEDPWLAGADLGFDPFNLSVQNSSFDTGSTAVAETTYYNYRESEVKHGRFAMAAFLAIFFETADKNAILRQLGDKSAVDSLDATLGLDELQAPVLVLGLGYQALAEYNLQIQEKDNNFLSVEYKKERCPGDLGFDPIGAQGILGGDKKNLHNFEVNFGRLAMIGVTTFLAKEFVVKDEAVLQKLLSDSAV